MGRTLYKVKKENNKIINRRPEPFDWYQVYAGIKDIITQYMNKTDKILNLGCGNSRLSEEMFEDGYTNITNIDFSDKVISQMSERLTAKCAGMVFKRMDVLDMTGFSDILTIEK